MYDFPALPVYMHGLHDLEKYMTYTIWHYWYDLHGLHNLLNLHDFRIMHDLHVLSNLQDLETSVFWRSGRVNYKPALKEALSSKTNMYNIMDIHLMRNSFRSEQFPERTNSVFLYNCIKFWVCLLAFIKYT